MSAQAIVMMLVAMLVLWGGLGLAIRNLLRFRGPEPEQVHRDL